MFSIKVIIAIQVFQELAPLLNKREGTRRCVISLNTFSHKCAANTFIVKSVLILMLQNKWISMNYRGYYLLVDPEILTLFDVYSGIHGGIPIGESMSSDLGRLYRHNGRWKTIERVESKIIQELITRFKEIRIADMNATIHMS